jgi:hypothetical protein
VRTNAGFVLALLVVTAPAIAQEAACQGLHKLIETRTSSSGAAITGKVAELLNGIAAVLANHPTTSDEECASLSTVMAQLINPRKHGGMHLEEDKPLDVKQAEAQIGEARKDPAINGRIQGAKAESADGNIQLVLEAAILDSEGLNSARDLQIQTLRKSLELASNGH